MQPPEKATNLLPETSTQLSDIKGNFRSIKRGSQYTAIRVSK